MSNSNSSGTSRRDFLGHTGALGSIALAWMLHRDGLAYAGQNATASLPHFAPKVRRVVQIFACGGVSQVDTFDYKPELKKYHGKSLEGRGELRGFFGKPGRIMQSPFTFRPYGECGAMVSDVLPHIGSCADEIAFVHSMIAKSNNHTPATFMMNTGFTLNGFPSMGAWLSYGLGTENENLPTFVVLPDPAGQPAGASINWTAGFLPAAHQGVPLHISSPREPIANLATPSSVRPEVRAESLRVLQDLNQQFADANPGDSALTARVHSYELAARMQTAVPDAVNIDSEPGHIQELYGVHRSQSAGFGRNCLMARRLLERGVRFVQLFNGGAFGSPRINWDAHESVAENHGKMAATMDQPVAALIKDMKQRGMLDDTLIIWCTEFGRGPATEGIGKLGRDHHPDVFTCFLAGAGVKAGTRYGASDDIGFAAAENPVTVHDFHATILRLLGLNHERLTYYHNGVQRRLTDVHGRVVEGLLS